jgi:hypothetical protein
VGAEEDVFVNESLLVTGTLPSGGRSRSRESFARRDGAGLNDEGVFGTVATEESKSISILSSIESVRERDEVKLGKVRGNQASRWQAYHHPLPTVAE